PAEIAASMGKMKLAPAPTAVAATQIDQRVRLDIRHPNHSGMALDQMTLLYIPLRVVSKLEVKRGDDRVFEMAGSITLSENPSIEFDFPTGGADRLDVTMKDSDGAEWRHAFPVGPAS
ncbi:MAG: thiosulfate oxidation carrier complex protein SoxZ, partial [Hyphomicrobium sp.]